ncbi:MAG: hypothetical protein ACLU38_01160 [Dysosmobacter sp.]
MRPITDKAKVSREKLAWLVRLHLRSRLHHPPLHLLGRICSRSGGGLRHLRHGGGWPGRRHPLSVPFQLYGILTIVMIFLVALGFLPDYGPMKKAEERARTTGKVVADGSTPMLSNELDNIKPKEGFKANLILHFLIPAVIVVVINIGTYVIMGTAKTLEGFVVAVTYQAIVLLDPEGAPASVR